jgi:hypothetical protein
MDQLNKIVKFIIYKNGKNSTPVTKIMKKKITKLIQMSNLIIGTRLFNQVEPCLPSSASC